MLTGRRKFFYLVDVESQVGQKAADGWQCLTGCWGCLSERGNQERHGACRARTSGKGRPGSWRQNSCYTSSGRQRRLSNLLLPSPQAIDRLASLRMWRDEKSFESFVTSQQSPQPSELALLGLSCCRWCSYVARCLPRGTQCVPEALNDLGIAVQMLVLHLPVYPAVAAFFGNEGFVPLVSLHTKQVGMCCCCCCCCCHAPCCVAILSRRLRWLLDLPAWQPAVLSSDPPCSFLHLLHLSQMVGSLKMNGTARTGAFTADGTQLLTSGGDGTGVCMGEVGLS